MPTNDNQIKIMRCIGDDLIAAVGARSAPGAEEPLGECYKPGRTSAWPYVSRGTCRSLCSNPWVEWISRSGSNGLLGSSDTQGGVIREVLSSAKARWSLRFGCCDKLERGSNALVLSYWLGGLHDSGELDLYQ